MAERKKTTSMSDDDAIFGELAAGHFSRQTKQADKDSNLEKSLETPTKPVIPVKQPPKPEPPRVIESPKQPPPKEPDDTDTAEPSVEVEESQRQRQQTVEETAVAEEANPEVIEDIAEAVPVPDVDLTMELTGHIGSVFVESPRQPEESAEGFDSPIDVLLTDPEFRKPAAEPAKSPDSEIDELLRQQTLHVPGESAPQAGVGRPDTNAEARRSKQVATPEEEEDWDTPTTDTTKNPPTENLAEEILAGQMSAEAAVKPSGSPAAARSVNATTRKVTTTRRPVGRQAQGQFEKPAVTDDSHVPIASIPKHKSPGKTGSLAIQLAIVALALAAAGALGVLFFLWKW